MAGSALCPDAADRPPLDARGISLGAAFRCFLAIGITGFGGVLPVVVHELVRKRGWITVEEFTEILSLCQVLPGPNVINLSVVFGTRIGGWRGAVACLGGLMLLPIAIVLTLGVLYTRYGDLEPVARAVRAVAAAAAGLIAAVALRLAWPARRDPATLILAGLVVVLAAGLRLPLVATVALVGPLGIAIGVWRAGRGDKPHG